MKFTYIDTPMGSLADENGKDIEGEIIQIKRNRIFLDVGNKLQKGVIDHHHRYDGIEDNGKIYRCATSLVSIYKKLILDNIDEDADEIEIVLHNMPDFDCYASAFLTENLIRNKEFTYSSNSIQRFCEYTDKLDSGMLKIIPDNLEEVYAVGYAIYNIQNEKYSPDINKIYSEITKLTQLDKSVSEEIEKKAQIEKDIKELRGQLGKLYDDLAESIRLRWFKLFEIAMCWLEENHDKQLEHNNIFMENSEFRDEIEFIKKDFNKYRKVKDNKEYFQEIKARLPKIEDDNGKLYLVKGMIVSYVYDRNLKEDRNSKDLIFINKDEYNIALLKCWLRNDGYIFTIIPQYAGKNYLKKEDKVIFADGKNKKIELSRTIISVDPNSGYCLSGLAEVLEEEETKFENYLKNNCLVNGKQFQKRVYDDISKRRWKDDPIFNSDDPWYDGRNFKYTIVDSPRNGSLLSFYDIKKYAVNYVVSSIHVNDYVLRVVIPFQFSCNYKKLKSIFKSNFKTKKHNCTNEKPCNNSENGGYCPKDRKKYFLSYIHNYLYNDINNNGKSFHLDFDENGELYGRNGVIAYHYGTGCFYFTIKINNIENPNDLHLSEFIKKLKSLKDKYTKTNEIYLKMNEFLSEDALNNNLRTIDMLNGNIIKFSVPHLYYSVTIPNSYYVEENEKLILYKMAHLKSIFDKEVNEIMLEKIQNKMILEGDVNLNYVFSKECGVMLYIDTDNIKLFNPRKYERINSNFNQNYFDMFLLSINHRHTLMYLEGMLAEYDRYLSSGKISVLRSKIMTFTTQGWFNQVTEDEFGQEIYKKWQQILECQALYDEVLKQIESVDAYKNSSRTRFVEVVTFITFPIILITQLLSSGFIKTTIMGPDTGIDWHLTLFGMFISICAFAGIFFLSNLLRSRK